MFRIAEMSGKLRFQCPFQNGLYQVAEHRPFPGQPQPPGRFFRPLQKSIEHLIADQIPHRHLARGVLPVMMSSALRGSNAPLPRHRPGHLPYPP